jgi:hypothetical protein
VFEERKTPRDKTGKVIPNKVVYAEKEILLPFNIGTSSIIEVKKFEMLIFLPTFTNSRGNKAYREVYSAKFVY